VGEISKSVQRMTGEIEVNLFGGLGGMLEAAISAHPNGASGVLAEAFKDVGGLDNIVNKLNDAGLGAKVNSWTGNGSNMPITADEISSALGGQHLQQIAAKIGVPGDQVAALLAQHLPTAVNQGLV
jgi:uncharacterized protein YidB (DUF937 family)